MLLFTIAALAAAAPEPATADPALARMVAMYETVCLQAFPDDDAVDHAMAAAGATPLRPDQVERTLRDDPGRGWSVADGDHALFVFLELPPYHACSVRRYFPQQLADLTPYRAVADRYEAGHPGFAALPPRDGDRGTIHIHGTTDGRRVPSGGTEALFLIEQTTADPTEQPPTGDRFEYRFVHQLHDLASS